MENMRELLSRCLREDANGYVVQSLVAEFPTMQDLMNASEEEIRLLRGIGVIKAKQLHAILQFVKSVNSPVAHKRVTIRSPRDVYDFMRRELEYLQVEHFCVLGLNTKNGVLFLEIISTGSLNASLVHSRETFKVLIKRSCASCILVHNHPSCDTTPSNEDILLTMKLVECGELLGIRVLDHIIVGADGGGYVSFKEKGLI
jgi:DNA repair protein RadC